MNNYIVFGLCVGIAVLIVLLIRMVCERTKDRTPPSVLEVTRDDDDEYFDIDTATELESPPFIPYLSQQQQMQMLQHQQFKQSQEQSPQLSAVGRYIRS